MENITKGIRVSIRSDLHVGEPMVAPQMVQYAGNKASIIEFNSGACKLDIDDGFHSWTFEMFEETNETNDTVAMNLTRDSIFTLFNSLLVRERTIFKTDNANKEELLKMLWEWCSDKIKWQVLWSKGFRDLLDRWNVPYLNDLVRLEIPNDVTD